MNKNTKIRLNYLLGAAISTLLLWSIYRQVTAQVAGIDPRAWLHTGPQVYLAACVLLMFVNTSLEGLKWYLLCRNAGPVTYKRAFASYLAGVAFALVTPNRVGEYPGRVLFLGKSHTARYVHVSALGIISQLWTVYIFGFAGLVYYNIAYPGILARVAIILCAIANILAAIAFWRFESWLAFLERVSAFRKFAVYARLLSRTTTKQQLMILCISVFRFVIFAAQYLFLLRWMNVSVPMAEGFCMVSLFFWTMAVIPSVALTELGVRGNVCIYLFQHFSSNTIGMLAATAGIWLLNLILPAIFGSILILRMRLLS